VAGEGVQGKGHHRDQKVERGRSVQAAQDDHDKENNDDKDTQDTSEDYRDNQAECEGSG